jgi:hypothetical protein
MTNPELSRKVAKLFNQYKVPIDLGFKWAGEIENAKSIDDLSLELKEFIDSPSNLKLRPKPRPKA